jgi:hypothetical protein
MRTQLPRSSLRLLQLSFVTPRPCRGFSCICLTHQERRALRRVARIVRKWKRQVRRQARGQMPAASRRG